MIRPTSFGMLFQGFDKLCVVHKLDSSSIVNVFSFCFRGSHLDLETQPYNFDMALAVANSLQDASDLKDNLGHTTSLRTKDSAARAKQTAETSAESSASPAPMEVDKEEGSQSDTKKRVATDASREPVKKPRT